MQKKIIVYFFAESQYFKKFIFVFFLNKRTIKIFRTF